MEDKFQSPPRKETSLERFDRLDKEQKVFGLYLQGLRRNKALQEKRKITGVKAAEEIDIHKNLLGKYENGISFPEKVEVISRIAAYYNVELSGLTEKLETSRGARDKLKGEKPHRAEKD